MLEKIKNKGTDFVLKVKGLLTFSESKVYVKDLRKVMTCSQDGRKYQYPKNYDKIASKGASKIIKEEKKDDRGQPEKDKNGDPKYKYKLSYGGCDYELALVKKDGDKSYFTVDFLLHPKADQYNKYYKPFGFSRVDLVEHIPIFEVNTQSLTLTNSLIPTKKIEESGKIKEVVDEKGRNGQLLYTSDYKKLNTSFFEIRDQNGKLENDKSFISVPLVFTAGLAKVAAGLLTYPLMKLGEHLLSKQNPIAKFVGGFLFIPTVIVKNLVNICATSLKLPILLFVANKEKYGDAYFTTWKDQLKECIREAKSDFEVIKNGERTEQKQKDYPDKHLVGTWDELNARRTIIEKELEEQEDNKESSETLSQSQSRSSEALQLQTKEGGFVSGEALLSPIQTYTHVDGVQNRRNSQYPFRGSGKK